MSEGDEGEGHRRRPIDQMAPMVAIIEAFEARPRSFGGMASGLVLDVGDDVRQVLFSEGGNPVLRLPGERGTTFVARPVIEEVGRSALPAPDDGPDSLRWWNRCRNMDVVGHRPDRVDDHFRLTSRGRDVSHHRCRHRRIEHRLPSARGPNGVVEQPPSRHLGPPPGSPRRSSLAGLSRLRRLSAAALAPRRRPDRPTTPYPTTVNSRVASFSRTPPSSVQTTASSIRTPNRPSR